jgi:hypothetical protein
VSASASIAAVILFVVMWAGITSGAVGLLKWIRENEANPERGFDLGL